MRKIHIMSDVLASQVAAGEVVERPASVIKELVENSLDAGAKTITVEIRRGGISQMRVTDDGSGMTREDAILSIERHATSKIVTIEDLFEVSHLGFRGEALPSIASVSRMKIRTRENDSIEGTELLVEGGLVQEPRACGMSPGTSMEVGDLFFNTPARKKFLKSEETEAAHIEHQVRLHALAFPNVRFIFRKDGQTCFDLPGTDDLKLRIALLFSMDTANSLVRIPPHYGPGITINGFLMPASETRRTRKGQFIFLNNRPIEDKLVTRAIRDGYGGLPSGLHPALYLYMDMEPSLVDVNVHPAKREVRFRRPTDVATAIIDSISSTLADMSRNKNIPQPAPEPIRETPPSLTEPARPLPSPPPSGQPRPLPAAVAPLPATQTDLKLPDERHEEPRQPFPFRLIGTLKGKYGVFESEDGLVLLSPRAARERIIFEQLMKSKDSGLPGQILLEPILIEPDPRDFTILNDLRGHFEKAGIMLVPFGQRTLRIESIPPILKMEDAKAFLLDVVDRVTHSEFSRKASRLAYETFASELAKRSAQLEKINLTHITPLLKELLQCEVPYCTPGGKPTLTMYSLQDIARKFGIS